MKLNHINLPVPDVHASRIFLETYFGLRSVGEGENGSIVVLMDEGGSIVTLSNFNHADTVTYPGAFHIGFVQQSNEDVDAVNRRLRADGYALGEPKVLHGSYTFYVKAPGGFLVEVMGPMPGLGGSSSS